MPFTPFHWGLALLIQALLLFLDPIALFIGVVIPDIEGICYLLFPNLGCVTHGVLHSFFGATFLGIIVGFGSYIIHKIIRKIDFKIDNPTPFALPKYSLPICLLSAFIGTFCHVILDAFLYEDQQLCYIFPIENPFLFLLTWEIVYFFCIVCFILGAVILVGRYRAYFSGEELK
jgi:membrane-bound metal-dependent hydrolase YbcI (DUF457 family)